MAHSTLMYKIYIGKAAGEKELWKPWKGHQ
jgi:hypothetical protein